MKRWLHTHRDAIALAACIVCALVAAQINDDRGAQPVLTAQAPAGPQQ